MNRPFKHILGLGAIACAVFFSFRADAATVAFQDRTYAVSVVPLGKTVPASLGCDLVFVFIPGSGSTKDQKFLCIPSDPNVRAVFDPNVQRFYRVDATAGLINAFTSINSSLINLDGTLATSRTDTPPLAGNGQSTLESYAIPLSINPTKKADIAILDANTIAYRTFETNVYEITRELTSVKNKSFTIPLVATGSLGVDYDVENSTLLLVQSPVTDPTGTALPARISSYFRDGTKFSEIILDGNTAIPGYSGNASGIAWDVDTGDIYVLDGAQLIVFTLQRPTLAAVAPNHGPTGGGTAVQITGANFPSDATVFFDGKQVSQMTVKSSTLITCATPPHASGPVNVTMTGKGILPGTPLVLTAGYLYGNLPPVAVLNASPTSGNSPLAVSFDVGSSSDVDGKISARTIDFGDGNSYVFPTDLTVTTVSHTYTGNVMFTATLTVTDSLGPTASATQIITVGAGGTNEIGILYLKTMMMSIETVQKATPDNKDQLTLTGQVVLPALLTSASLNGGTFAITVNGITVSSATPKLGTNGTLNEKTEKFSIKLVKTPGALANSYAFAYSLKKANLYSANPTIPTGATRISIPLSLTLTTSVGRVLYYGSGASDINLNGLPKIAVVNVKITKKSQTLSLVRN